MSKATNCSLKEHLPSVTFSKRKRPRKPLWREYNRAQYWTLWYSVILMSISQYQWPTSLMHLWLNGSKLVVGRLSIYRTLEFLKFSLLSTALCFPFRYTHSVLVYSQRNWQQVMQCFYFKDKMIQLPASFCLFVAHLTHSRHHYLQQTHPIGSQTLRRRELDLGGGQWRHTPTGEGSVLPSSAARKILNLDPPLICDWVS